jgi:hypothetical protein
MNECPLTVDEAVDALNARDLAATGKEILIPFDVLGLARKSEQDHGRHYYVKSPIKS